MMRFIYKELNAPIVELSTADHITLAEALETFEQFLRACGYVFDGHVIILKE